jgi:hypothetical protein
VDVSFPAAGPWLVAFEVTRGADRVYVERTIEVPAPTPGCRLDLGPCTAALGAGMEVTLELSPRPLRTMRELSVVARVRGAPPDAAVEVSFEMKGMDMGRNRARLAPAGQGRFAGTGVLVRCPSGRKDWMAEVAVSAPGAAPRAARFDLAVEE